MRGEVHLSLVLYKRQPPGAMPVYRRIAVVEREQFQVRVFEGKVVQTNPKFIAENSDAEVHMHQTLRNAIDDAESEFKGSAESGEWEPYHPAFPPF
jgi:hypothetical protein